VAALVPDANPALDEWRRAAWAVGGAATCRACARSVSGRNEQWRGHADV